MKFQEKGQQSLFKDRKIKKRPILHRNKKDPDFSEAILVAESFEIDKPFF